MSFGKDYREEVRDANEGRITQHSTAITSNQTGEVSVDAPDTGSRTDARLKSLMQTAGAAFKGIEKRQDKIAYQEAYNNGSQEKLNELNKHSIPLFSAIFGHSAEYKGFQQRVVDNEVQNAYTRKLNTVESDATKYATLAEYKESIDPELEEVLGQQTDQETRDLIVGGYTKNVKQLAGQYVRFRKTYEQVLNRNAAVDNLEGASKAMDAAAQTSDPVLVEDANARIQEALTRKPNMEQTAYEDIVVDSIKNDLANGNTNIMGAAQAAGTLNDFSPEALQELAEYKATWNKQYSRDFYTKADELEKLVKDQDEEAFPQALMDYANRYPNVNTETWQRSWDKEEEKVAKSQRELQANTLLISQGRGKLIPKGKRDAAYRNKIFQLGQQEALAARKINLRDNPDSAIPLDEEYTLEERNDAIKDNPSRTVATWKANQISAMPVMTAAATNIQTLTNLDSITVTQEEFLKDDLEFMQHFIKSDRALLAKQMPKSQIATLVHWDTLINEVGMSHREALLSIREGRKREPIDTDTIDLKSESLDAVRNFTDNNGFENFLGWSSDPDNMEVLEARAMKEMEESIKFTNDIDVSKRLVMDLLAHESTRFGDSLLLGGKELDKNSKNGDFAAYSDEVEQTQGWKDAWEAAGFPRNRSIKDDANVLSVTPDGRSLTIRSENVNGQTIWAELPAPTSEKDLLALSQELKDPNFDDEDSLLQDIVNLPLKSFIKTGDILNDIFAKPSTPESHLPKAPAELAAPQEATERSPVIESILEKEGGLSLKTSDKGNFNSKGELVGTNFGISAQFLEKKLGRPPTKEDVKNLTEEQAAEWHQENIDTEIAAVTKQSKKEVAPQSKLLLSHMVTLTSRKGVLKVFKNLPDNATPEQLAEEYLGYLKTLSSWKANGKGWTNRVNAIVKQST